MMLNDASSAAHVFNKIPFHVWQEGQRSVMRRLRMLSTESLSTWGYEDVLNFLVNKCMNQRLGAGYFLDEWNPLHLLHSTGFGCLYNCESVLAFEEQLNGDAKVRLSFSEAHRGGTHREETITVEDGRECFFHLRSQLQAELRKSGNIHWGDISDVKALSDTLDVGIFIFCERLQNKKPELPDLHWN